MVVYSRMQRAIVYGSLIAFIAGCSSKIDFDLLTAPPNDAPYDTADDRDSIGRVSYADVRDDKSGYASVASSDASIADRIADISADTPNNESADSVDDIDVTSDALSDIADVDIANSHDSDTLADADAGADTTVDNGCTGTTSGAIDLGRVVSDTTNLYFIDRAVCAIKVVAKNGGTPVTLVQKATPIRDLTISAGNLYFTTSTAIEACATSGCENKPSVLFEQGADRIVTDDISLYFTSAQTILKCPIAGCRLGLTTVASMFSDKTDLVTDGSTLFWIEVAWNPIPSGDGGYDAGFSSTTSIASCSLNGCAQTPRYERVWDYAPGSLSSDGKVLAWAAPGSKEISAWPIQPSGSLQQTPIAERTNALMTLTGEGRVYWWDASRIFACPTSGCRKMPAELAIREGIEPSVVAVDSTRFYWFERKSSVFHACPLTGCDGTVTDAIGGASAHPPDLATNSNRIIWLPEPSQDGASVLESCNEDDCAMTTVREAFGYSASSGLLAKGPLRYFFEGCGLGEACHLRRGPEYWAPTASISGTVYGGPVTVDLSLDLKRVVESLQLTTDGPFTFQYAFKGGDFYSLDLKTSPPDLCRVINSGGTIYGGNTTIVIACRENARLIGGQVQNLGGQTVVLQNNGVDILQVHGDQLFSFPIPLAPNTDYDVTVLTQPTFHGFCVVENGKGKTSPSNTEPLDVTNIVIDCASPERDAGPRSSGLTADDQYLYWILGGQSLSGGSTAPENGAALRMPIQGGPIQTLASGIKGIGESSTAVDTNYLYFSAIFDGTINKVPVAGGAVTTLATGQAAPTSLVVNGTTLFWATATDIVSLDLATPIAKPIIIAPSPAKGFFGSRVNVIGPPRRLIFDSGYLYWVTITDTFEDKVERAGLHGENHQVLAPRQSGLGGGIAIAGGNVFFTGTQTQLMSVPVP